MGIFKIEYLLPVVYAPDGVPVPFGYRSAPFAIHRIQMADEIRPSLADQPESVQYTQALNLLFPFPDRLSCESME
jgi:hypothetical protein